MNSKKNQNKFLTWLKSSSSDIWLFIIALVLLNMVASRAFFRIDLTSSSAFSLSKASKEVVKNLEEPLNVKVFFSNNLPSPYSNTQQYVQDILIEYKNAANSNFAYEYFNMDKDENIQQAMNYGLNQLQIREVKNNEVGFKNAFMGIVLTYADQIEVLDGLTSNDGLEYKITSTIGKIIANTNVLSGLSSNVKLTFYKSESLAALNLGNYNNIDSIVNSAFEEANKKFEGRLEFSKENPNQEEADELAERFGLSPIVWNSRDGATGKGSLGLVIEYDDKFRVLPFVPQNMIFQYVISGLDNLAENISENVQALVSKTSDVAYVTGHGELGLEDSREGAANFVKLCSDTYSLNSLDLSSQEIPLGIKTLIINGAKTSFSEDELYKIDQFLMKGGNLMLFVDPYEVVESQSQYSQYQQPPQYVPIKTGLEKLLSSYGIECGTNYVYDENCYSQNNQQYGKLNFNFIPMLQKDSLSQKNPITKNLGYVLLMQMGSLDVSKAQENKNLKTTILASSSPKSWTVTDQIILNPLYIQEPSDKSAFSSYNLIALLEGKFTSAYDVAPNLSSENQQNQNQQGESSSSENLMNVNSHLKSSTQNAKIFIASSSFITSPQLVSGDGSEPIEILLRNAVDYMNGNEDFCAMRTKTLSLNTLKDAPLGLTEFAKYFNEFGLAILVALCGLFVFLSRKNHREKIRLQYDPEDSRIKNEN